MRTADEKGPKSSTESASSTAATAQPAASDDGFDPYDRSKADGLGSWAAAVHIVRSAIGSGVLLMPYTIKRTGYLTGPLLVLSVGFVYFHTLHMLIATEYRVCKRLALTSLTYIDLADKILQTSPFPANKCRKLTKCLMYAFYALPTGNATYLIVMANGVQTLAKFFDLQLKPTPIICVLVVPLTLLCMCRRLLQLLVPYSSVANLMSLAMAAVVVVASTVCRGPTVRIRPFGDAAFAPYGVAICAKAFRCTTLVLPLRNAMREPKKLRATYGVLNAAASTITVFYCAFGVILYLNYGDEVRENVLSNMPAKNYVTDAISLLYAVTLSVSYILTFFGRFDTVWSGALKRTFAGTRHAFVAKYGVRVGINALAFLLAVAVPNLAIISAFAGVMGIVLEVALPALLELLSVLADEQRNRWLVAKDVGIIAVSLALFCMGLISLVEQVALLYAT